MTLNLVKTYSVKSNAQADLRKAIGKGEAQIGQFTVVTVSGGFKIAPHDVVATAASWQNPRWPDHAVPGGEGDNAKRAAAIVADSAEDMTAKLAASRDEMAVIPDEPVVTTATTPGLARLRANGGEAIRLNVLAEDAAEMEKARKAGSAKAALQRVVQAAIDAGSPVIVEQPVADPYDPRQVAAWAAERAAAAADEPAAAGEPGPALLTEMLNAPFRKEKAARKRLGAKLDRAEKAAKPEAAPAKPAGGLSEGATAILRALFKAAGDAWIDQKEIPHGMTGKAVPGYLSGLTKRGLVEARADGGNRFSARILLAGVAALGDVEAGR
jgi:hypothetical protein